MLLTNMKKSNQNFIYLFGLLLILSSCGNNEEIPEPGVFNCDVTTVTFSGTIKNIITTKCAITGCHDGDNGESRNWTVFANVQSNAANIKARTATGTDMPLTGSLTQEQIDQIACWVDQGALNN